MVLTFHILFLRSASALGALTPGFLLRRLYSPLRGQSPSEPGYPAQWACAVSLRNGARRPGASGGCRQRAVAVIGQCLLDFLAGIHHERAILYHRLA